MRSDFIFWYCCECGDGPHTRANHVKCISCDKVSCNLCIYEEQIGWDPSFPCVPVSEAPDVELKHATSVGNDGARCPSDESESSPESYCSLWSPSETSHSGFSTPCATSCAPAPELTTDPQLLQVQPEHAPTRAGTGFPKGFGHQPQSNRYSETHISHAGVLNPRSFSASDIPASAEEDTGSPTTGEVTLLTLRPKLQEWGSGSDPKPSLTNIDSAPSPRLGSKGKADAKRPVDKKAWLSEWLGHLLPHLDKTLPAIIGSGFTIDLFRDRSSSCGPSRAIHVTSPSTKPPDVQEKIRKSIVEMLPESFAVDVNIFFFDGVVERACCVRGDDEDHPDRICQPQWTRYFERPSMGASIGLDGGQDTATLGGYVTINGEYRILTVHHLFEDEGVLGEERKEVKLANAMLTQPSAPDMETQCTAEYAYIGHYMKSSGYRFQQPLYPYCDRPTSFPIEMDWALCSVRYSRLGVNVLPKTYNIKGNAVPAGNVNDPNLPAPACLPDRPSDEPCQSICEELSDVPVHCMARTSGYQVGLTSECPSLVNYSNGRPSTMEWAVIRDNDVQTDSQWVSRGVGLGGDSGAWILRLEDNAVCGMIWGRSRPYGPGERKAYFTPMAEIFADIESTLELPKGCVELPHDLPPPSSNTSEEMRMDLEDVQFPGEIFPEESAWRSSLYSPGGITEDTIAGSPEDGVQISHFDHSQHVFRGLDATLLGCQFAGEGSTPWVPSGMETDLEALESEELDRCSVVWPQNGGRKRQIEGTLQTRRACVDCSSLARDKDLLLQTLHKLKGGDDESGLHPGCLIEELQESKAARLPSERTLSEVVGTLRSNKRRKVNDAALEQDARLLFRDP